LSPGEAVAMPTPPSHHRERALDARPATSKPYVFLISLVAAVGGLLFGYDLSIISGAVIFLEREFSLSALQMGWVIGSASLGCISGPLLAAWAGDQFGRKKSLVVAAVLFGVCAAGTAVSHGVASFSLFRIVGGMGVGVASVVSPMYIAEIAPARLRGRLVSLNQLAIVVGSTASIVVSYYLSFTGNWRAMFLSMLIPALVLLMGVLFVPESPRWLVQENQEAEALAILARVDGEAHAQAEVQDIRKAMAAEKGTVAELFAPGVRVALLIAVLLGVFQQWTGVSPITFYAPIIFQKAGFSLASDALRQTIIFNLSNLIGTVTAMLTVDRLGRRPLLLVGTAGMALGQFVLGTFFWFDLKGIYVVVAMFLTVGTYALSMAPMTWLVMSEMFPARLRAKGQSAGALALWIATYTSTQAMAPAMRAVEQRFGSVGGVFWFYALVCIAALLFIWRMVPETKGRTLEEIGRSWHSLTSGDA
jgi:SP family arabinose:H+ symporter-like MFS transporter